MVVNNQETPEEFLQRGGSVKKLEPGATGEDEKAFSWNSSRYPAKKNVSASNNTSEPIDEKPLLGP